MGGNGELTRLLLRHGALLDVSDLDGRTCIHITVQADQEQRLAALLHHPGARALIDARDAKGLTAYHYSLLSALSASQKLLAAGADRKIPMPPGEFRDRVLDKEDSRLASHRVLDAKLKEDLLRK